MGEGKFTEMWQQCFASVFATHGTGKIAGETPALRKSRTR
jgi:hypothetical protein